MSLFFSRTFYWLWLLNHVYLFLLRLFGKLLQILKSHILAKCRQNLAKIFLIHSFRKTLFYFALSLCFNIGRNSILNLYPNLAKVSWSSNKFGKNFPTSCFRLMSTILSCIDIKFTGTQWPRNIHKSNFLKTHCERKKFYLSNILKYVAFPNGLLVISCGRIQNVVKILWVILYIKLTSFLYGGIKNYLPIKYIRTCD